MLAPRPHANARCAADRVVVPTARRRLRPAAALSLTAPALSLTAPALSLTATAKSLAAALACCAVFAAGCHAGESSRPWPKRVATPGKATLPPTPDLSPKPPPSKLEDGAWTVHGLREAGLEGTKGIQTVTGHVIRLHTCPADTKRCDPAPFAQIADTADGAGERLLLGGERALVERGWKEGDRVTVRGLYVRNSPDGVYFSQRGMLLLAPPQPEPAAEAPTPEAAAEPAGDKAGGGR